MCACMFARLGLCVCVCVMKPNAIISALEIIYNTRLPGRGAPTRSVVAVDKAVVQAPQAAHRSTGPGQTYHCPMTLRPQPLSLRLECVHLVLQLREDRTMVAESARTPLLCLETADVLLSQGREKKGGGRVMGQTALCN